jgi:DNA-binding TFAR19-related protein (PDSD5 family)
LEREKVDPELELIERRKLAAMRRRLEASGPRTEAGVAKKPAEKTDRQVFEALLYDRGTEVLEAAYSYFPRETPLIVSELAREVRAGNLNRMISGGELYALFRQVGLRFQLKTSIKVQDRGKLVDLSEKLKLKEDE